MLTVPKEDIVSGNEYWVLEWCTELGKSGVYHHGPATITVYPSHHYKNSDGMIESSGTGFTTPWSNIYDEVEVWGDDDWYMAIFPDEQSMKQYAQAKLDEADDDMPLVIFKELTALVQA
jgi:hypothetical protein